MEDPNVPSQLILELLSSGSPELGARLKQRLNLSLVQKGFLPFNEKNYGYKRFADFLQGVLGDKVSIERPDGTGDIFVSLRHHQAVPQTIGCGERAPFEEQSPVIRSDVWQAFINPDPERKRFLNQETRAIRHFRVGDATPIREEVERDPSKYVEIDWISGATQLGWMRAFLDSVRVSPSQRTALEALVAEPYTSGANATFTRALGEHGNSWRHYRVKNVTGVVQAWAAQHDIPFDDLCVLKNAKMPPLGQSQCAEERLKPRLQASKLLELLTEDDISQLVIPFLVSTVLVKSRL